MVYHAIKFHRYRWFSVLHRWSRGVFECFYHIRLDWSYMPAGPEQLIIQRSPVHTSFMCRRCPLKYEACTKIKHFYSRWCNWYPDDKKDISCLLFLNVEDFSFFEAAYPPITTYKTDLVWCRSPFPYRRATAKHLFFAYGTDGQPPKNTLGESLGVSFIWKKSCKQHRSLGKCPWNLIGDNRAIPYYRAWFWS